LGAVRQFARADALGLGFRGGAGLDLDSRRSDQRSSGFALDAEKYNEAALLGWRALRVTTGHWRRGHVKRWVCELERIGRMGGSGGSLAQKLTDA